MRVISLFSGAGGLDLGFLRAGHDIVWANDFDPDCVQTYSRNIGSHIELGDISKFKATRVPDCDMIIGGFPCQGFSCANLKRSPKDERNSLYLHFLRFLRVKKPKYFLAENVRGLLSLSGGRVMDRILKDFSSAGYHVEYKLVNFADFGVPQMRYRVFIIGKIKSLPNSAWPSFPLATHAKPSSRMKNQKPWVTIGDALKKVPEPTDSSHNLYNHVFSRYKITNRNFTGHRWTDPNKPSPTILARGNAKGGVCALQHPRNHRRLSVRESAIIQGFPHKFIFGGSLNSMYRQVGNAVPPLFAEKIAREFKELGLGLVVNQ